MRGKTVYIDTDTYDKLLKLVEIVETQIYELLPEHNKYYPRITQSQIITGLICEELTRLSDPSAYVRKEMQEKEKQ